MTTPDGSGVPTCGPALSLESLALRPAVVVMIGTSGSGKTTLRRTLVAAGLHEERVVSLDDLRRRARSLDLAQGRPARPLQQYSAIAVRHGARRAHALAAFGAGYLADATHLRRRDRVEHVLTASVTGLDAIAVLTPVVPVDELIRRNAARALDEQVPVDVLEKQAHRRSLLSTEMLFEEGFSAVRECGHALHDSVRPVRE